MAEPAKTPPTAKPRVYRQFHTEVIKEFIGTVSQKKIDETLTNFSRQGWTFEQSIYMNTRSCLLFNRQALLLIFSRPMLLKPPQKLTNA